MEQLKRDITLQIIAQQSQSSSQELNTTQNVENPQEDTFRYNSGYISNVQPGDRSKSDSSSSGSEDETVSDDSSSSSDSPPDSPDLGEAVERKRGKTQDPKSTPHNSTQIIIEAPPTKFSHQSRSRERSPPANSTRDSGHCRCCIQEVLAINDYPEDSPIRRGLPQLFNPYILRELTAEDPVLNQMCTAAKEGNYEKFAAADKNMGHFFQLAKDEDGILIIDNRLAIPSKLRNACLNWLHRNHPGQMAMVDAANYLWWPKMHSQIIEKAESCSQCRQMGKNLKPLIAKRRFEKIKEPSEPNEEVQLDFAGPLFNDCKTKTYLLVAVDSYSRFPSVAILKSTGSNKIIKFLKSYISTHGVPRRIKTDQFSGFKSKELEEFCKGIGIDQDFCPVDDHRGCGIVERCIQTLKRRIATCLLNNKNLEEIVTDILFSLRTTKHSATKKSPFYRHFGRQTNTTAGNALKNILDRGLRRPLLTADDRRRTDYSKYRLKRVGERDNSEEVAFLFPRPSDASKTAAANDALTRMGNAISE